MAKDPVAKEQAAVQGVELVSTSPQEFAQYLEKQIANFGRIVKATRMRVD